MGFCTFVPFHASVSARGDRVIDHRSTQGLKLAPGNAAGQATEHPTSRALEATLITAPKKASTSSRQA